MPATIDLFSLYVLFIHIRSCDETLENGLFQIFSYSRAYVYIIYIRWIQELPWDLEWANKTYKVYWIINMGVVKTSFLATGIKAKRRLLLIAEK